MLVIFELVKEILLSVEVSMLEVPAEVEVLVEVELEVEDEVLLEVELLEFEPLEPLVDVEDVEDEELLVEISLALVDALFDGPLTKEQPVKKVLRRISEIFLSNLKCFIKY